MLITITMTGNAEQDARDLGYLLHKNPYRAQQFAMTFGKAYVFYPTVERETTTAALLLDINPIDLARGKKGSSDGGLFDYVNDRPYVNSSFMSTAIAKVFGTALNGKCAKNQQLADTKLPLEVFVSMLNCGGEKQFVRDVFEPLGYQTKIQTTLLDEEFSEWGESPYIDLTLKGCVRLSELLNHLYVLLPVFDQQKHYYTAEDEIEKLVKHGEFWLKDHPEKNRIIRRYFHQCKSYANEAIKRISVDSETEQNDLSDEFVSKEKSQSKIPLNKRRLEAVKNAVLECGAKRVADLGCGDGKLTALLMKEPSVSKIAASDVSVMMLERAKQRIHYDKLPDYQKQKITFFQSSLIYRDDRFSDYDAICVIEVIEHIDSNRTAAFERVIFEYAKPRNVILTTPNREYNVRYGLDSGETEHLRHSDHRFEWNREQFQNWCSRVCQQFSYSVDFREIGDTDKELGAPTQMAVFTKCE